MTTTFPSTGRLAVALGVLAAVLGLAVYLALFLGAGVLHMPWYTLGLSVLGLILVVYGLRRKRTAWRVVALVFVGFLVAVEGWFLFAYTRNPVYAGPAVGAGIAKPFVARLSDGKPFTNTELAAQDTLLIFYRGHW